MGHKKHSSRKSKHNTTNNNNHNNNNIEDDKDNGIITSNIRNNSNKNNKSINDVNQYIYKFISSEEFNNCYPIIAFQSSILLSCIEYSKINNQNHPHHHQLMDQNLKIPVRELLINAEKKIKDWEERARKSL